MGGGGKGGSAAGEGGAGGVVGGGAGERGKGGWVGGRGTRKPTPYENVNCVIKHKLFNRVIMGY